MNEPTSPRLHMKKAHESQFGKRDSVTDIKMVDPTAEPIMASHFDLHAHRLPKISPEEEEEEEEEEAKQRASSRSDDASMKNKHHAARRGTRAFPVRSTTSHLTLLVLLLLGIIPSSYQQKRGGTQRQHIFQDVLHNTIGRTNNDQRKLMKGKKGGTTMMLGKTAAVVGSISEQLSPIQHNFHNSKKSKSKTTLGTSQKLSNKSTKKRSSSTTTIPEEPFTGVFASVNRKPQAPQQPEIQPTSSSFHGWLRFQSTVLLELNVATALNWTTMEQQELEQLFTTAYNDLSSQECDVYERQVLTVDILKKDNNALLLHIKGKCYGCDPSLTTLLSSSSSSSPSYFGSLPPYYSAPQADTEQRDQRRPPSPYSSSSNTNTYTYAPIAINRRPPTEAPQSLSPTLVTLSPTISSPLLNVVTIMPVNTGTTTPTTAPITTTTNNNRAGGFSMPTLSDRESVPRAQPINNNGVEAKGYHDNFQYDNQGRLVKKARSNTIKSKYKLRKQNDPYNNDNGFSTSWSNTNDRRHHHHRHLHQIHAKNTQRHLKGKSNKNSATGGTILTTTTTTSGINTSGKKSATAASEKSGKSGGKKKSCKSKSKSKKSTKGSRGSSKDSFSSDCCSNGNASYEAPTENELLLYLNHLLAQSTLSLRVDLVVQLLTKECSTVEEALGSSLIIPFVGQQDQVTQNEIALIQKTIVDAYQRLQAIQCDTPYFRQLTSATLQSVSEGSTTGSFLLNFTLQGTCRGSGCAAMVSFFQAATTRRRQLSSTVPVPYLHVMNRYTPAHEPETTCLCSAFYNNAGPPSIADFNELFAEIIQLLIGQGLLQHIIASMQGFETGGGPVGPQRETFQSCIAIQFFGVANGVTENEVRVLEMVIPEVYNDLQLAYCDPLSRECSSATVTYYDPNPASTESFILGFQLEGTCLGTGCSSNGIKFFREGIGSAGGGRFLQSSPTCKPGQTEGAPSRDEFAQALASRIQDLSNDGTLMDIGSSGAVNQDICPTSMPTTIGGMTFTPTFSPSAVGKRTEAPTSPGATTAPSMVSATGAPSPLVTSASSKPGVSLAPTASATTSTPTSGATTTAPTMIFVTTPTASATTSAPTSSATTTGPTMIAVTASPTPAQTMLTANPTSSTTTMSPTGLRGSLGPTTPNGSVGTTAPTPPTVPGATGAPTTSPTINETFSPTAVNITAAPTLLSSTAGLNTSNAPSVAPSTNQTLRPSALNVTLSPTIANITQSPTAPNVTLSPSTSTTSNITTPTVSNITVAPSAIGTLAPTVAVTANTTAPTLMTNISNATLTPTQSPTALNVTLAPSVSNVTATPSAIATLAPTVTIIANTTAPTPISNISNATLAPSIASISNQTVAPTTANASNVTTAPSTAPGGGESLSAVPTISNFSTVPTITNSTTNLTSTPTVMQTIFMNTSSPTFAPSGIVAMNMSSPTILVMNTTSPTQTPTISFVNQTNTTGPTQTPTVVFVNGTNTTGPTSLPTQVPTGLPSLMPGPTNAPTLTGNKTNITLSPKPTIGPITMTTVPTLVPTQVSNMSFPPNSTALPSLMPTGSQPLLPGATQAPTPIAVGNGPTIAPNANGSNIPTPTVAPTFLTNITGPSGVPSGISTPAPFIPGQPTTGTSNPTASQPILTPTSTAINSTTMAPTLVGNFTGNQTTGIPGSTNGPIVAPTVPGATPSPTLTATVGTGVPSGTPSIPSVTPSPTRGFQTSMPTIAGTTNRNVTGNETTTVAPNSIKLTTTPTVSGVVAQPGQPTVTPTTLVPTQVTNMSFPNTTAAPTLMPTGSQSLGPSRTQTPTIAVGNVSNITGPTIVPSANSSNIPTAAVAPSFLTNIKNITAQPGQPTVTPTTLVPTVVGGSMNSPTLGPSIGGIVPSMTNIREVPSNAPSISGSTNPTNMTNTTMGAGPNNTTNVPPNNNGTTSVTTRSAPLAEDIWEAHDVDTVQVMPGKFRKGNTGEDATNDKKGYAEITEEERAKWAGNHEK